MACYHPIAGWRSKKPNENGKYPIVFKHSQAQLDDEISLPCNKCIGCRLDQTRAWGIRCMHEMQYYDNNCFVTLTYDDEHLPHDKSVDKKHLQAFFKNLRHQIRPKKIRFFACGEYGTEQDPTSPNTLGRPHYHAIIFNHDFADQELFKIVRDNPLYTSASLSKIWKKGHATVQEANFRTAQYTAGYITKKIGGDLAETHYQLIDPDTGEITNVNPEFMSCSTGTKETKGLGYRWAKTYLSDLDKGYITFDGQKVPYPKYYDGVYKSLNDEKHMFLRDRKQQAVDPDHPDYTAERLRVRELVHKNRTKLLTQRQMK